MKLSIILPCFNGADTIATQLEALVIQQCSHPWEVIVVNNGSTDDSMPIAERFRDRLPDLRIVDAYTPPGPRLGVSHSYNVGVQAATGDAFVFCEADDEVAPDWLAAMARALTQFDFVACRLEYGKLNQPWRLDGFGEGFQTTGLTRINIPPYLPFANGCSFGLRRVVYETVGQFNTNFPCSFEADFCWRAQLAGFELHFVPDAVMHYRLRHSFSAMYRQARNYGKDFILLQKYYQNPMGKLAPVKLLLEILQSLPQGGWLFLKMRRQASQSKGRFAMWFWSLGLKFGTLEGLLAR